MKRSVALLVLACLAIASLAHASPVPPDPELWVMDADGTGRHRVAGPAEGVDSFRDFAWSPDSTRVVAGGLVVIDVDTGEATDLGSGGDVDWSPVSDEIVFTDTSSSGNSTSLYLVDADGSDRRVLVEPPLPAINPVWSPDGEQVAFLGGGGSGEPARLFVVDADGSDLRELPTPGSLYKGPAWSPDGGRLAFVAFDYTVYVVNADGSGIHAVGDYEYASDPAWCPDGTLYVTAQAASDAYSGVYAIAPDGTDRFVAEGAGPDCSATGKVAFAHAGDVYVIDPASSGTPNLTNTTDMSEFRPRWSPDGTRIAYVGLTNGPDPVRVERSVTLNLGRHLVARGAVGPSNTPCPAFVKLQRMTTHGWKRLELVWARDLSFRTKLPDRPGLYRAVVAPSGSEFGEYRCLRAVSDIVRHRH